MIDPLTALSVASTAVGQIKQLMAAGRDASSALSKFAGAVSDINYAAEKAKNPSIWKSLTGSPEAEAIEIFTAQKKLQRMKTDVETLISFQYGPKGLEEYKETLRSVKKQRQKTAYRKQEIKEEIVLFVVGTLVTISAFALLFAFVFFVGRNQGKW